MSARPQTRRHPGHRLKVTVDQDLRNVEEVVSDVEVSGYALTSNQASDSLSGHTGVTPVDLLDSHTLS